jgi:hypothetical protein
MNTLDSEEMQIERFQRTRNHPLAPPPIPAAAAAEVRQANRMHYGQMPAPGESSPQSNPWINRGALAIAIALTCTLAGSAAYYVFSEARSLVRSSHPRSQVAQVSDEIHEQAMAPLHKIPPTAPVDLNQWVPDATGRAHAAPAGTAAPAQAQAPTQAQAASAPQTIVMSAAAPIPAPASAQAQPLAPAQALTPAQAPAVTQAPAPAQAPTEDAAAEPAAAPTGMTIGPMPPRMNPRSVRASPADEPNDIQQPSPLVVRSRTKEARFHSGPGVQYPVIAIARPDTRYAVADWSDRWFKVAIKLPAGEAMGWIRNDQVLVTPGSERESLPDYP